MAITTYTAWAYHADTGRTRRSQRRHHSPETARRAAEALVPAIAGEPWDWAIGARGATRATDHEGARASGDWILTVRPHAPR